MSVTLAINLCTDSSCSFMTFSDQTGAYTSSNVGGYGGPNENITSVPASLSYSTAAWTGGSATFNLTLTTSASIGGSTVFTATGASTVTSAINTIVTLLNVAAGTPIASYNISTGFLNINWNISGSVGNTKTITWTTGGASPPTVSPSTATFTNGTDPATAASLVITDPNNNVYTLNPFSTNPSFPTTNTNQLFYIYPNNLNQSTNLFLDGTYKFQYTVTYTDGTTSTVIVYKLMYCNAECCVSQMFANITDIDCDCQKDLIDSALKAQALLYSLKRQAKCGTSADFNNTLTVLQRMCQNINCETCS